MEFAVSGYTGEIAAGFCLADLPRELERLVDPGAALKTLHWGRNYLYLTRCDTLAGPVDVVVKQFRNGHLRDRVRRRLRGSKAAKSWQAARALRAAGIATPEPLLLAESRCPTGPSFYVSRYVAGLEARYLLRAANAGRAAELFPAIDLPRFLRELGGFVRRLHDASVWHRDLSSGNVLLADAGREGDGGSDGGGGGAYDLFLVDLNRARLGRRLTLSERARDLSRMNLERPQDRRLLLAGYWESEGRPPRRGSALYGLYYRGFRWKNEIKRLLRRDRPAVHSRLGRVSHAHIPEAPAGAPVRDLAVWDRLSDQPHQHAGGFGKLRVRLSDAAIHAQTAAIVARSLPRIWRRYRELPRALYGGPVAWDGAGLCLRPWPEAPDALLGLLEELGARHLLLRLHPWQEEHDAEEALAAELHRRGYELSFALPQNRALVRDPARWRAALAELGERFARFGPRFQIGQAINRSKWGVWNLREYLGLARAAEETLRRLPGVELLGPAVIDFEYHLTAAVLNAPDAGFRFDAVSALLYVDRRGAPENRQAGFDTVDKVRLLRAIAETSRNSASRCWITEVNWPLWEGPHSPAGRSVSVDEETQANYLVRYYLPALGSGLVERVFWWQLAARGYGLVDPAEAERPRRRPSFLALRTLLGELAGCRLEEILAAPPHAHLFRFRRPGGGEVVVGWSSARRARARLPRPAARVVARDGGELAAGAGAVVGGAEGMGAGEVELSPSPAYYHLIE
jgi:hypothetical protein